MLIWKQTFQCHTHGCFSELIEHCLQNGFPHLFGMWSQNHLNRWITVSQVSVRITPFIPGKGNARGTTLTPNWIERFKKIKSFNQDGHSFVRMQLRCVCSTPCNSTLQRHERERLFLSVGAVEKEEVRVPEDEPRNCKAATPFFCDLSSQDVCIDQSQTCNGVSECSSGRDESVEICGEFFVFVLTKCGGIQWFSTQTTLHQNKTSAGSCILLRWPRYSKGAVSFHEFQRPFILLCLFWKKEPTTLKVIFPSSYCSEQWTWLRVGHVTCVPKQGFNLKSLMVILLLQSSDGDTKRPVRVSKVHESSPRSGRKDLWTHPQRTNVVQLLWCSLWPISRKNLPPLRTSSQDQTWSNRGDLLKQKAEANEYLSTTFIPEDKISIFPRKGLQL